MTIISTTESGVAILTIARPEKRNALTDAMYQALADGLRAAAADRAVRAVVLTGVPGIFTAGNDIEDLLRGPAEGDNPPVAQFVRALIDCDTPVIAAVTGSAVGIGATLLLHCDFVYVADDARLTMPFVRLGLCPELGSSELLPRLIGHARAAEKLLLGEPFTAAEAVAWGLANAALPAAAVLAHARRIAERVAELPPGSVRATKRLLRHDTRALLERALAREAVAFTERLASPEAKEAFEAFLGKRRADFSRF
jgi:enoyl-CoA hydratase/carnithine racemase